MKCKLCASSEVNSVGNVNGYQEPTTFQVLKCQQCETKYASDMPDAAELYNLIYSQGKDHPGYGRYLTYSEEVLEHQNPLQFLAESEPAYFAVKKALQDNNVCKSDSIVEIGSGLGYLTYALRKAGLNSTGLDISQVAVASAVNKYGDYYICEDLADYAEINPNKFDYVIATELIEHVSNPIEFLGYMRKILKPNGKIILTTPNMDLWPEHILWETTSPPIHHWWFSQKSMEQIGKLNGLNAEFISFENFYGSMNLPQKLSVKTDNFSSPSTLDKNGKLIVAVSNKEQSGKTNGSNTIIAQIKSILSPIRLLQLRIQQAFVPDKFFTLGKSSFQIGVVYSPQKAKA